jgi:hypothetical protein
MYKKILSIALLSLAMTIPSKVNAQVALSPETIYGGFEDDLGLLADVVEPHWMNDEKTMVRGFVPVDLPAGTAYDKANPDHTLSTVWVFYPDGASTNEILGFISTIGAPIEAKEVAGKRVVIEIDMQVTNDEFAGIPKGSRYVNVYRETNENELAHVGFVIMTPENGRKKTFHPHLQLENEDQLKTDSLKVVCDLENMLRTVMTVHGRKRSTGGLRARFDYQLDLDKEIVRQASLGLREAWNRLKYIK